MLDSVKKSSKVVDVLHAEHRFRMSDRQRLVSELEKLIVLSQNRLKSMKEISENNKVDYERQNSVLDSEVSRVFKQCLDDLETSCRQKKSSEEEKALLQKGYMVKSFLEGSYIKSAEVFLRQFESYSLLSDEMLAQYQSFIDTLTKIYLNEGIMSERRSFINKVIRRNIQI